MPPTNETPHRHARKAASGRRKAKPKFEIPEEAAVPESADGWVYRADEVLPPTPEAESETPTTTGTTNPLLVAGMGLFFLGVGTVGLMSLATIGVLSAPFRFARNVWAD